MILSFSHFCQKIKERIFRWWDNWTQCVQVVFVHLRVHVNSHEICWNCKYVQGYSGHVHCISYMLHKVIQCANRQKNHWSAIRLSWYEIWCFEYRWHCLSIIHYACVYLPLEVSTIERKKEWRMSKFFWRRTIYYNTKFELSHFSFYLWRYLNFELCTLERSLDILSDSMTENRKFLLFHIVLDIWYVFEVKCDLLSAFDGISFSFEI